MWATFNRRLFVRGDPAVGASNTSETWMHFCGQNAVLDSRILADSRTPYL